jgi:glycine oxidase
MSGAEVAIIGGGVAGCSTAYHLAKQGVGSLIIERDAIASQASGKAWGYFPSPVLLLLLVEGTLVPKGSMRPCLSLTEEGFRRIAQLARELKEESGVDTGHGELPVIRAVFDESEEKDLKERVPELKREGFEISWIEANEVKARSPDIAPGVRGGMFFPGHQVEPYKYTLALAQAAEAKGASIRQGEAVGFRAEGTRVTAVTLAAGGVVEADAVVLAMGPWTGQGTSWLGKEIATSVHRDQCLVVEVPQRLPPVRISSGRGKGVSIVPKVDGKVILGRVEHDVVDFDERPTEEFRLSVMEAALATLPGLEEAKLIEHRAGLEAWQTSGVPMLGRLPGWDNVYVATWLATFGIQWSPAVGRIMADFVIKGHTEKSVEPFDPARYV